MGRSELAEFPPVKGGVQTYGPPASGSVNSRTETGLVKAHAGRFIFSIKLRGVSARLSFCQVFSQDLQ